MANEIESISYINLGNGVNHPIDAVTVGGITLTSEEKEIWNEKQDALTFDSLPTENSDNLVKSGALYAVITENEIVTAAALNDLNDRVVTLESVDIPPEITEATISAWGFTKNSGTLTSESDPVFMSSAASSITAADISNWNSKTSNTGTVTGSSLTADKVVLGAGNSAIKNSTYGITTVAPSAGSGDTDLPTSKAVYTAINSALTSVLEYKGTVGTGGDVTSLPASHTVGDVYVVCSAGTYAGKACEVGDYIICKTTGSSANDADWDVVNGENQVDNKGASLPSAGASVSIATVDGTDITITTPSSWTGVDKMGTLTSILFSGTPASVSVSDGVATVSFTYDSVPTENSDNLVKSGDLYRVIVEDEVATAGAINNLNTRISSLESGAVTASQISAWNAKQDALVFDSVPTASSSNMVKSSGIYDYITDIELVTATALNDLNDRMTDVETSMSNITETDPVFTSSAAYTITSSDISSWNGKHDVFIAEYGVTTNDEVEAAIASGNAVICSYTPSGGTPQYYSLFNNDRSDDVQTFYGVSYNGVIETIILNENTWSRQSYSPVTSSTVASWGFLTSESDPVFMSSAASTITAADISNWNSKQDVFIATYNVTSGQEIAAAITAGKQVKLFYNNIWYSLDNVWHGDDSYHFTSVPYNSNLGGNAILYYIYCLDSGVDWSGPYEHHIPVCPGFSDADSNKVLAVDDSYALKWMSVLTSESDPVFASSVAASITAADISNWNAKQDALVFDSIPTASSSNLVKSGDLYDVIVTNERVVATALNDTNDRLLVLENYMSSGIFGITFNGVSASVSNNIARISVSIPAAVTSTTVASWGFLTSESDPVFASSVAASITAADISAWNAKQDALVFDSIPTASSSNMVKSGGIYDMITSNELVTASALNDLNNRVLDLEDFTESDPTVPAWAKASTKPSYTAQEVGALPASTVIPSVDNYFDDAVYDSNTKRINFKHGSTVKKYIDTTDFGGGISSINFNGVSASVSNGVASISVSIPEPLWVDQNTYFSTLSNAFSEYQQILMEFGDGTYYSNTDLVLRCTDKTRYNNQVAYHFTGSLYAPNDGKYYITDVILGEASGGACTVLSISHKEIPDTVTASTVASWGFLSSESDPVFASSVAASISAADITNWNSKTSNTGTVTGSSLTTDKIIAGNNGTSIKATAYTITQRIPSSGGDTLIPTYTVVSDAINTALTTVLKYKGTIGTSGDVTSLPSTHAVGDVYVVSTASTYAGKACEVGDYIICKTASSTANNAHWDVVNGENQVDNKGASLAAAGSSVSIATVDGTNITISTPASWTGVDKVGTLTGITFNGSAATVSNGIVTISESDPVFSASAAAGISAADITNWNSKTSNTGTITGISMNGASKGTSGNVNLGTVVTGISFNGTAATISNGVASISAAVLPTVSAADSGKILQVSSNGSWALVTPVNIYNGSSAPNNANGNNGDIYIQTS